MTTEVHAGPIGEIRSASSAGGGTALTSTAAVIAIPDGARHLFLSSRNFVTGVVAKFALNPYLIVVRTTDSLATATDASQNVQDGKSATVLTLNSQPAAAAGGYLFVGSHLPFRGVAVTVVNTNGTVSVLAVKYWNSAWTSITPTDGTTSGGATFAQNANVTWTVPTDWVKASLLAIGSPAPAAGIVHANEPMYWTRWDVSVALDSSVTVSALLALNQSTAYAELLSEQSFECRITKGPGGIACVEALTDAGTGNLIVNVASSYGEGQGIL